MNKKIITLVSVVGILLLMGCVESSTLLYRVNVQQGNILTSDMVRGLRLGMCKDTVIDVIGAPVLFDTFNPDRWSYVYIYKPGKKDSKCIEKHLVLYFRNDKLVRIDTNGNLDETPTTTVKVLKKTPLFGK